MKRLISAILLVALPFPAQLTADEYSAIHIRTFTRYLIGRGEYYRARLELQRLASYHPGSISPLIFHVTEDYVLFKGKQYSSIISKRVTGAEYLLTAADFVFKCDAYLMRYDYLKAEALLTSWNYGVDMEFDGFVIKRKFSVSFLERKFDEAEGLRRSGMSDSSAARELLEQARKGGFDEKIPALAAVLGIVPGMGYIYSGQIATGIIAFLLIALNALVCYYAFRTHNNAIGYITGIIGGFFYAGSIAGAYLATRRFNMDLRDSMQESVTEKMKLEEDRGRIFDKYGIGRYGKP